MEHQAADVEFVTWILETKHKQHLEVGSPSSKNGRG
jgi:hypothetical protein